MELNKEDKELVILWFKRVKQLATDMKNLTNHQMSKQETLNVIRVLAKDAIYYLEHD